MFDKVKSALKLLTNDCKHPRADRYRYYEEGEIKKVTCLACDTELPIPTTVFRNYVLLRKHIKMRVGMAKDRSGKELSPDPKFAVGLRFVIPGNPKAIRRAWVTFDTKKDQKSFAEQMDRRLRVCQDDEGYNEVINEALDLIRAENPDVEEQVGADGDTENDEA